MKLSLKTYTKSSFHNNRLPDDTMAVWVSEVDMKRMCYDTHIQDFKYQKVHIEIVCKHIVAPFTMYSRICDCQVSGIVDEGELWIPKDMISKNVFANQGQEVEVRVIDINELPAAASITIQLNPEQVVKWSQEEVDNAIREYRSHNDIAYVGQRIFIKPGTKQYTIADAVSIFPHSDKKNQAYRIDKKTQIVFEGLPENLTKVIELSDVGGLNDVVDKIRCMIQIPLNYPEYMEHFNAQRPKGLLLYGPPGNGKTMIAGAIARSMGAAFIEINITDIRKGTVGQGEAKLREKFAEAESRGNGVIFIDEIDSVASMRSDSSAGHEISIVGTLLGLMDGLNKDSKVFVIGATNRPDAVDPALRRTGRFDIEIEIPLPNLAAREDILLKYISIENKTLFHPNVDRNFVKRLAELTSGYSGSDIKALYREAAMSAIREQLKQNSKTEKYEIAVAPTDIVLEQRHFIEVVRNNVPSALRGLEMRKDTTLWENIIALDDEKKRIERLHLNLVKLTENSGKYGVAEPLVRPSFSNILLTGKRGTGKHTFISAFARRFEYEMFDLDFITLEALETLEAYRKIDLIFSKCRQITPSILVLSNLEKVSDPQKYTHKILNEISKTAKHLQIIVCCIADNQSLNKLLCEYKGFTEHFDFDKPEQHIYITSKYKDIEIPEYCRGRIGATLAYISEQVLLQTSNN